MRSKIVKVSLIYVILSFSTAFSKENTPNLLSSFLTLLKNASFYLQSLPQEIPDVYFPQGPSFNTLHKLVKELRANGYPVGIWKVSKEDVYKIKLPFLTFLKNRGWIIVKGRVNNGFIIIHKKKETIVSNKEFLENWAGWLMSLYMCNIWLTPLKEVNENGEIYIIYSYHDEKFSLLKKYLDGILTSGKKKNKKVLYVDELGLIPLDSINNYMKIYHSSEKETFERIKQQLVDELKNISQGIPIYDSLETYNKLYHYLAKHKIECTMEDLDYINWRKIVILDHIGLLKSAFLAFYCGDVDLYVDFLSEYNNQYWKYNIKERDNNFVNQIIYLAKHSPQRIIFTVRGLSHLWLEERLAQEGFNVKFVVIGDDFFLNNISYRHFVFTDYNLHTKVDSKLAYTYALVQESVRDYLVKFKKLSTREAIIKANELIKGLTFDDISSISTAIAERKINESRDKRGVLEFIYSWVENKFKRK